MFYLNSLVITNRNVYKSIKSFKIKKMEKDNNLDGCLKAGLYIGSGITGGVGKYVTLMYGIYGIMNEGMNENIGGIMMLGGAYTLFRALEGMPGLILSTKTDPKLQNKMDDLADKVGEIREKICESE